LKGEASNLSAAVLIFWCRASWNMQAKEELPEVQGGGKESSGFLLSLEIGPSSTTPLEWERRVTLLTMQRRPSSSESSKAQRVISLASWGVEGSSRGTSASLA
jgi:hypothetical protein